MELKQLAIERQDILNMTKNLAKTDKYMQRYIALAGVDFTDDETTVDWEERAYAFAGYNEFLKEQVEALKELAEMVQDNTKMPHQHSDYYERLCCLSERARETLEKVIL